VVPDNGKVSEENKAQTQAQGVVTEQLKASEQPKTPTRLDISEERLNNLEDVLTSVSEDLDILTKLVTRLMAGGLTTPATPAVPLPASPAKAKRGAKRVKDNKMGVVYRSLGECGVALAKELGLDEKDPWVFYAARTIANTTMPNRIEQLDS